MRKYTTEQIRSIVDGAINSSSEKIASNFATSLEYYYNFTEQHPKLKGAELYFAAISTSQITCANVLEDVLKKVLCD